MRQLFSTVMASVQNIGINGERNKAENEPLAAGMSKDTSAHQLNRSHGRDSYWFAYGRAAEDASPANAEPKASAEEKLRVFREHQEQERLLKLRGLEQHFLLAKQHREQQEQERRRRIEEARVRETERRQQVEERKRQIWEAEQERKEAILRRNMEREARIEARRNAHRNAQSFAFGSSTPRTFDLDLAAIGLGRHTSLLMASVASRRSEERDTGPPRATSACSLDRKFGDDCMSRSMVSLSSSSSCTFRGRRRTDITPTPGRERSVTPHVTPRGSHPSRAVSMTRLDQLAQPRRAFHLRATTTTTEAADMSKSMCNLAGPPPSSAARGRRSPGTLSRSMLHLAGAPPPARRPSPTHGRGGGAGGLRPAQSMVHLAAPPRLTRAARLRAEALAGTRAASAWNLSAGKAEGATCLAPGKDSSRSPSRPQSSMSGTSDVSATSSSVSAVNMRPRPAPRRPRPYSVAGSLVTAPPTRKEPDRQPRGHDRSATAPRAKSACRESEQRPLSAPRKPLPPPKSSEVLAKAKSHPVPTKDNLRKMNKPAGKPAPPEEKARPSAEQKATDKIECKRKEEQQEEMQLNSAVTSPTTDSEMLPMSSDDSKTAPTSDVSIQSVTESEPLAPEHAPPVAKAEEAAPKASAHNDIPIRKAETAKSDAPLEAETPVPAPEQTKAVEKITSTPSKPQTPEEEIVAVEKVDPAPIKPLANSTPSKPSLLKEEETKVVEKTESPAPSKLRDNSTPSKPSALKEEETKAVEKTESPAPSKPRISSEEEARAALAEKRRLAREQAEREAELERQRLEEIRRQEEEQREREEQEQRRMEEEQLRLAELHRQLEQEKLAKAIQEQQQREREEQERREEEARQRLEKEEQEKKAREEAERQRVELEEKLRKEEEERAERKRRVEQIMARTRGKAAAAQQSPITPTLENKTVAPPVPSPRLASSPHIPNGRSAEPPLPDILNAAILSGQRNGAFAEPQGEANPFQVSKRTVSANGEDALSPQSNGYGSHEDMSCTTSPEESPLGLLIDIQSSNVNSNDNFLIHMDDVNDNLFSSNNPFNNASDTLQKKQEAQVTDLLS